MTDASHPAPPAPLTRETLGPDPIEAVRRWLREAEAVHRLPFPEAACLSTVDPDGWPEGRIVLVKSVDARGLGFFTNYRSAKGQSLERNPRAALTLYWGDLARQVRVQGGVERLPSQESDDYFATRPRGSQIGAWASDQSEPLDEMSALHERARAVEERFGEGPIPRPEHWGGFLLRPRRIEFWQEGANRLHHRLAFSRKGEGAWKVERFHP